MESIRKAPLTMNFNQVSIIGKVVSEPRFSVLADGKKVVNFSMSTDENILDRDGNVQIKRNLHRITAFGRWARVLRNCAVKECIWPWMENWFHGFTKQRPENERCSRRSK